MSDKHNFPYHIRDAHPFDKDNISTLLHHSISEICYKDHLNDPETIACLLANKTPQHILDWINTPTVRVLVAEKDQYLYGVGATELSGQILLNYVAPEGRFKGISKMILLQLETYLTELGVKAITLSSTKTAIQFYSDLGYKAEGDLVTCQGMCCQPMIKLLS